MDNFQGQLTVYFEDPFWVGVFERIDGGRLSVSRVVFGPEPKGYDIYEFILRNYGRLTFSPSVEVVVKKAHVNPKRQQREARKQTLQKGIGTRSQQALQLQREANKQERKVVSREAEKAFKQRKFELRQQKRKEKHRGR